MRSKRPSRVNYINNVSNPFERCISHCLSDEPKVAVRAMRCVQQCTDRGSLAYSALEEMVGRVKTYRSCASTCVRRVVHSRILTERVLQVLTPAFGAIVPAIRRGGRVTCDPDHGFVCALRCNGICSRYS